MASRLLLQGRPRPLQGPRKRYVASYIQNAKEHASGLYLGEQAARYAKDQEVPSHKNYNKGWLAKNDWILRDDDEILLMLSRRTW